MFSPTDDTRTPESGVTTPPSDGATQVWDPALWAAYLHELVQDERKRTVN